MLIGIPSYRRVLLLLLLVATLLLLVLGNMERQAERFPLLPWKPFCFSPSVSLAANPDRWKQRGSLDNSYQTYSWILDFLTRAKGKGPPTHHCGTLKRIFWGERGRNIWEAWDFWNLLTFVIPSFPNAVNRITIQSAAQFGPVIESAIPICSYQKPESNGVKM